MCVCVRRGQVGLGCRSPNFRDKLQDGFVIEGPSVMLFTPPPQYLNHHTLTKITEELVNKETNKHKYLSLPVNVGTVSLLPLLFIFRNNNLCWKTSTTTYSLM